MFDWNAANVQHIANHGITPEEAEQVVENDPLELEFNTRGGETRAKLLGETDAGRLLVVVTTWHKEGIRVVTAYPPRDSLRRLYEQKKGQRDEEANDS